MATRWIAPSPVQQAAASPAGAGAQVKAPPTAEQVRGVFEALTGNPEFAAIARDVMLEREKELGLGAAERRHVVLPETVRQADELTEDALNSRGGIATPIVRACDQWMRAVLFGRAPMMEVVKRALSIGTDSAGGYVVPPGFIPMIVGDKLKKSQLYQYTKKIPAPSNTATIPNVASNVSVTWTAEGTDVPSNLDPSFGEVNFTINRCNALVKISRELANDSNPGVTEYVVGLFGDAIVKERDRAVAVGSGSSQPLGLYSASGITAVTITTLDYDSLVSLHEAIDERYMDSAGCRWTMNQTVKQRVMKIKDDQGQPIFQLDRTAGFRAQMFGHGVSIESSFPNNYIGFGDLEYYMVADRETLGVERSTEAGTAFQNHQLWIKFFERWDGRPVLPPTVPLARARTMTG